MELTKMEINKNKTINGINKNDAINLLQNVNLTEEKGVL